MDWSLLNSPTHRALSREAAAKSTVLLKNTAEALPLKAGSQRGQILASQQALVRRWERALDV